MTPHPDHAVPRSARPWLALSAVGAGIAIAGSVAALMGQDVYAGLTSAFLPQALAQDIVNLLIVAPALVILVILAHRGSRSAYLLWLGALLFTVYNYVIYTVAIPFGPLFLPWVAVLGCTLFALLGGSAVVDRAELMVGHRDARTERIAAWMLVVIALLFGGLWLADDLPALLEGAVPTSLRELGIPTNPVHVLDLAFFLPATVLVAVGWLRGSPRAGTMGPAFLAFLVLTGLPILVTPIVQSLRGEDAAWAVVVPIGIVTLIAGGLLVRLLGRTSGASRGSSAAAPVGA